MPRKHKSLLVHLIYLKIGYTERMRNRERERKRERETKRQSWIFFHLQFIPWMTTMARAGPKTKARSFTRVQGEFQGPNHFC